MGQHRQDPEAPDALTNLEWSIVELADVQVAPIVKEIATALRDAGVSEHQIYPRAFMSIELAMMRLRETFAEPRNHWPHER